MRAALKHTLVALAAACALGASAPAHADPVTLVTLAAYASSAAGVIAATTAAYIALGVSIVGGIYARKQASRASAAAREAQAAAMTDRCVTLATAEPEPNVVYGRCAVGGWVIDKITTAKTYIDDRGSVRTKPDAYQHIVIGIAGHECQAVHDVFMYGDWVGSIGADGWVTGGPVDAPYGKTNAVQASQAVTFTAGAATLIAPQQGYTISRIIAISQDQAANSSTTSHSGATLTGLAISGGPASGNWVVTVEITRIVSSLRIEFHLGAVDQLASPYLRSVAPTVWTDAHRLLGITYAVITFDLDDSRHQGIPGDLAFEVSGRKVLDPRTGTTAWSRNSALCVYDWMRAPWGYRLGTDDIDTASVIAAATAADQLLNLAVGGVTTAGPRYTLDGAFGVNADKSATLADMLETMGGFASQSAQWAIHAGAWTAPVMSITDDDLAAPVRIVRSHTPIDERFNAAKATYLPERKTQPSEVDPYINTVFVGADGGREWGSFTLPFTNNKARGRNLLRQFVEQSRAGLLLQYTGKMRLWPLQVGDRVAVTSSRFGLVADTFRVIDWSWSPGQPVSLTLQRDIAASYDDADASSADPAPATRLPNPGVVDTPSGLTAASGTAQLLKMADGTIIPRVLVGWTAPTTIYMSDPSARTIVSWRRPAEVTWNDLPALAGNTTSVYLDTVRDRDVIIIRVQHINGFGVCSAWVALAHSVVGKTEPPASPTALAVVEAASAVRRYTVTHAQDVDHAGYIVRYSPILTATFDQMLQIAARWDGDSLIGESSSPLDGTYRFGVAAFDTTGNLSSAAAYVTATLSGLAAISGAANAAKAAADALAAANNALLQLQAIASNGILSRGEKPDVITRWNEIYWSVEALLGTATALSITTERDAAATRRGELANLLNSLAPAWNDTSADSTIIPGAWNTAWDAAYQARAALDARIGVVSASIADWSKVTGRPTNVAGLIGTEDINNAKLGQASNLINCQTEFANNSTAGWAIGSWVIGMPFLFQGTELTRWPPGDWVPPGGNAIVLYQGVPATTANTSVWGSAYPGGDTTFGVAYTEKLIPVVPKQRYCASAFVASHRCTADIYIEFHKVDGSLTTGSAYENSGVDFTGGKLLTNWKRLRAFGVAPDDAVGVRILFAKRNTLAGNTDSYAWMTQPMIEAAGPLQTVPSNYSPSAATSHSQLGSIVTSDVADNTATDVLVGYCGGVSVAAATDLVRLNVPVLPRDYRAIISFDGVATCLDAQVPAEMYLLLGYNYGSGDVGATEYIRSPITSSSSHISSRFTVKVPANVAYTFFSKGVYSIGRMSVTGSMIVEVVKL